MTSYKFVGLNVATLPNKVCRAGLDLSHGVVIILSTLCSIYQMSMWKFDVCSLSFFLLTLVQWPC